MRPRLFPVIVTHVFPPLPTFTAMSLQRVVYLITSNAKKLPQLQRSFGRFGITVLQADISPTDSAAINALLHSADQDAHKKKGTARTRVLAVLREETRLEKFGSKSGELAQMLPLERVQDVSTLTAYQWSSEKQAVETKVYREVTGMYAFLHLTYAFADCFYPAIRGPPRFYSPRCHHHFEQRVDQFCDYSQQHRLRSGRTLQRATRSVDHTRGVWLG
jgi:hypothetical protein